MALAAQQKPNVIAGMPAQYRAPSTHACEACGAPVDAYRAAEDCGGRGAACRGAAGRRATAVPLRSCGAETLIPADTRSFTCPFCNSNCVIELAEAATHRYLVSASRDLPQADAEGIKPFQLAALKRYQPAFLAGWSAYKHHRHMLRSQ